jgi:hypothetical protein
MPTDVPGRSSGHIQIVFGFQWTVSAWNLQSGALLNDALQPANVHKFDILKFEDCIKELAGVKE